MPARLLSQLRLPQLERPSGTKEQLSPVATPSTRSAANAMDHIIPSSIAHLGRRSKSYDKHRQNRRSLGSLGSTPSSSTTTTNANNASVAPVHLNMVIESPPVLFLGNAQQSSGALISGRLQITPTPTRTAGAGGNDDVVLEDITMYLECTTTWNRPARERCRECTTKVDDLHEWHFLTRPKTLSRAEGTQELPFSHLIPGSLAVTTHARLGAIDYSLHVRARTSDGRTVEFRRDLPIRRALAPGPDKQSVRVFPPTDLILHVTMPNIVYPIGQFTVQCRLTGLSPQSTSEIINHWRLRKLTWRIEENESGVSRPCPAHQNTNSGKCVAHDVKREVGSQELREGWKTDFSGEGSIEGEFPVAIDASANPQCAMELANGLKVSHQLILELIVAEEWISSRKPNANPIPSGAARSLRAHFALNLSQRAGLGIAWDEEMPPVYADVPASPPHYSAGDVAHYDANDLHEDVERSGSAPS